MGLGSPEADDGLSNHLKCANANGSSGEAHYPTVAIPWRLQPAGRPAVAESVESWLLAEGGGRGIASAVYSIKGAKAALIDATAPAQRTIPDSACFRVGLQGDLVVIRSARGTCQSQHLVTTPR